MRNDETDEGEQSRNADCGSREQGGKQKKHGARGFDVYTEPRGIFFPERHHVQHIGKRDGDYEGNYSDHGGRCELRIGNGGKITDLEIVAEYAHLRVECDDRGGYCVQKAIERNTCEDQGSLGRPPFFRTCGDQKDSGKSTQKGKEGGLPTAEYAECGTDRAGNRAAHQ